MGNLDWLVVADWVEHGVRLLLEGAGHERRPHIDTTVYFLPAALIYEKPGIILNSGRWLQWRYTGRRAVGRGQARLRDLRRAVDEPSSTSTRRRAASNARTHREHEVGLLRGRQDRPAPRGLGPQRLRVRSAPSSTPPRAGPEDRAALRRSANLQGRRLHGLRHVDLHRLLGQQRRRRSTRPSRPSAAAWPTTPRASACIPSGRSAWPLEPPHHLQPRLGRHAGQALEPRDRVLVEWTGEKWVQNDVGDFVAVSERHPRARPTTRRS